MAKLKYNATGATVNVKDELKEKFLARGFVEVAEKPKPAPAKTTKDNKGK